MSDVIIDAEYMGQKGLWTGLKDKAGQKIHIGDAVEIDGNVWNKAQINIAYLLGKEVERHLFDPHRFVVEFSPSDGLNILKSDAEQYFIVIRDEGDQ